MSRLSEEKIRKFGEQFAKVKDGLYHSHQMTDDDSSVIFNIHNGQDLDQYHVTMDEILDQFNERV